MAETNRGMPMGFGGLAAGDGDSDVQHGCFANDSVKSAGRVRLWSLFDARLLPIRNRTRTTDS